jgi:hypothetical protein
MINGRINATALNKDDILSFNGRKGREVCWKMVENDRNSLRQGPYVCTADQETNNQRGGNLTSACNADMPSSRFSVTLITSS